MNTQSRRRRRDPEGRRQAIIDAATRVIADVGVAGLTHRRVAEVADVPVGSTTYYFKDLDELRETALAHAAHTSIEDLHEWARTLADTTELSGALARLTGEYLADHDRYRAWNELYTAASHRPELRHLARLWSDGLIAILEPYTTRSIAESVSVFVDGALLHALTTGQPLHTSALTEAFAKLLAN